MLFKYFVLSLTFWTSLVFSSLLGIDYGSGFSKAVVVGPQTPLEIVLTDDTKRKQVSGLGIKPLDPKDPMDIERIYGSNTQSFFTRFPSFSALHLKSLLGKTEVPENFQDLHPGLEIVADKKNSKTKNGLKVSIGKKSYPVEELIAMDFNKIISNAENLISSKSSTDKFTNLGVSVPAWYSQDQRKSIMDVVSLSKITDLAGLVDDGIAVGINYAIRRKQELSNDSVEYFVVYDMGQESTKVSLLGISNMNNEVLSIDLSGYGYDAKLGGDILTSGLTDLIVHKFLDKYGKTVKLKDLKTHHKAMAKIIQAAEKAKLVLSANNEASVSIESLYNDDIDFRTTILRSEFEASVLMKYTTDFVKPLSDALESSSLYGETVGLNNLSSIILTGGSSRIPFVQQALIDYLGKTYYTLLSRSVNADEAVVNGLGIRSIQLSNAFNFKQQINIVDRSVLDYSIVISDEKNKFIGDIEPVFPVGSEFPAVVTKSLSFDKDVLGSKDLYVSLLENDTPLKDYRIKLSQNSLSKKINASCSSLGLNVTMKLNENRMFDLIKTEIVCLDETSESSEKPTSVYVGSIFHKNLNKESLSTTDLKKIKKDLQIFNERDLHREVVSKHLNALESLIYELRSILEEHEADDILPDEYVDNSNEDVSNFLEWLDFETDSSTSLEEIEEKYRTILVHKKNILSYIESIDDPLDFQQFTDILANCSLTIEYLDQHIQNQTLEVLGKVESFDQYNASAIDLYYNEPLENLRLPADVLEKAELFNQTYDFIVNEFMTNISMLLENEGVLLKTKSRMELFEVKNAYTQLMDYIPVILENENDLHTLKIRFLDAQYTRALRKHLREEERKKFDRVKHLSLRRNGTLLEDILSEKSKTAMDDADFVTLGDASATKTQQTTTVTSTGIPVHDEL